MLREAACQKTAVIANQPAGWCGDPPNLRETYVFRVENVAFNRGALSHYARLPLRSATGESRLLARSCVRYLSE